MLAIAGIAFACVLIFTQLGFLDALFRGAVKPHNSLVADVVIANPRQITFFSPKSFSRRRLAQVRKYNEVESTSYVLMTTMNMRNPITKQSRPILVFGMDPASVTLNFPELTRGQEQLKLTNRVFFDRSSRPEYGPIAELLQDNRFVEVELGDRLVKVVDTFEMGASFTADGTIVTSDSTFRHLYPKMPAGQINLGLINLKPGVDADLFVSRLKEDLGDDIAVYTREGLGQIEKDYWSESTGVGFVFGLGVFVGFIVGVVIVYQILHADVADHLPQYATLKAMGYTDQYLSGVLVEEALILACLGFIPGLALSLVIYKIAQLSTMMPIEMTGARIAFVYILTLIMCLASALVASRKLRNADPAEIF